MGSRASHQHHRPTTTTRQQQRYTSRQSIATTTNEAAEINEADFNYIVEQTGMSRAEIRSMYKQFVRESLGDGELDLSGFVAFYKSLSTDPPAFLDENPAFIFDVFDKDHNGKVSFREFMCAYVLTSPGRLDKKLAYTFELYDLDNNGYLDIDEIFRCTHFLTLNHLIYIFVSNIALSILL